MARRRFKIMYCISCKESDGKWVRWRTYKRGWMKSVGMLGSRTFASAKRKASRESARHGGQATIERIWYSGGKRWIIAEWLVSGAMIRRVL